MPNGFWYAGGDYTTEEAKPASAFSKGDLLQYNSNSSLSRVDERFPSGGDIAGVALADSVDSIQDRVPYLVPQPDTLFWASFNTAHSGDVTAGDETDISFAAANNRYYVDPASTNSVRAVVVRGVGQDVISADQSVQSKVLCKLIYHAGNLDLS